MNILLDTRIALWSIAYSDKLPQKSLEILQDANNTFFVSIAPIWEVAIKHSLHPEEFSMSEVEYARFISIMGFNKLSIEVKHILALRTLGRAENAPKHNDPFDRIMIAQAKSENMIFLTHDKLLPFYEEDCICFV